MIELIVVKPDELTLIEITTITETTTTEITMIETLTPTTLLDPLDPETYLVYNAPAKQVLPLSLYMDRDFQEKMLSKMQEKTAETLVQSMLFYQMPVLFKYILSTIKHCQFSWNPE